MQPASHRGSHTRTESNVVSVDLQRQRQPLASFVCFHIRDEIAHGISDTPQSIPTGLPSVDPQTRLQSRLSCECFTYSGHFQGIWMQFVPSWRPKISQKSPEHSSVSYIRPQAPMTASACVYHLLHAVKRGPMSTFSSTFTTSMEHYLTSSQPWVGFCSSSSTHNLTGEMSGGLTGLTSCMCTRLFKSAPKAGCFFSRVVLHGESSKRLAPPRNTFFEGSAMAFDL